MLGWIIGGGVVALLALFFVIGTVAQKKHGEDMVSGGTSYIRFAAAVILSTLLERVQRPEMTDEENAQRIDIARVSPAAMAAGQKVFGDAMTEGLMKDELKTVVQYRANHLIGVKEHEMHELAKKMPDRAQGRRHLGGDDGNAAELPGARRAVFRVAIVRNPVLRQCAGWRQANAWRRRPGEPA
ncbi:hypothetical protein [Hyphomonas sp.]|uniref:hypothetical protein n=1 Tax=Hyphomonas sp. TaxID=87 RepID=UPI00356920D1